MAFQSTSYSVEVYSASGVPWWVFPATLAAAAALAGAILLLARAARRRGRRPPPLPPGAGWR